MKIISHRGYWKVNEEKNTFNAFKRSFSLGYGTETDIRDYKGELVISHDIANDNCISFSDFLESYIVIGGQEVLMPLALNIKSDGLQEKIKFHLNRANIQNYFLFDMSIPDLKVSIDFDLNVFSRLSEYERDLPFYEKVKGIWLDAFKDVWYTIEDIKKHLNKGKTVCIVSSELHKRDYLTHWKMLRDNNVHKLDNLILCTDLPEEATEFFKL